MEFTDFLATLHWSQGGEDLGKLGISHLQPLFVLEQNIEHRLTSPIFGHEDPLSVLISPLLSPLLPPSPSPPVAGKSSVVVSLFKVWSGHLANFWVALPGLFPASQAVITPGSFILDGDSVGTV